MGNRNREYVSIFADEAPQVLAGRSPVECYAEFMHAFREAFIEDLGTTIEEVVVGTGPCGELRYPSYVEANGWRFPGVGPLSCPSVHSTLLHSVMTDEHSPRWEAGS